MREVTKKEFYRQGTWEVTKEDSYGEGTWEDVTEKEFYETLFDLVRNGLLRPTGEYRDGQPVYIATPEEEKSDEAKKYENKITRHRPN